MIIFLLAIISTFGIIISFKFLDKFNVNIFHAIVVNYFVAFLFCVFINYDIFNIQQIKSSSWLIYSLINGVTFILMFYIFGLSMKTAGVIITVISRNLSIIIPIIFAFVFYEDKINSLKIIGIVMTLLAFSFILLKKENTEINFKYILLPLIVLIGSGFNDTMLNYVSVNVLKQNEMFSYLTIVFFTCFVIGIIILSWQILKLKVRFQIKSIFAGVCLGIVNFLSTYYFMKVLDLKLFESSVFFPLFNAIIIVISALFGYFIFKEKLSKINLVGLIIAVIVIILIAGN